MGNTEFTQIERGNIFQLLEKYGANVIARPKSEIQFYLNNYTLSISKYDKYYQVHCMDNRTMKSEWYNINTKEQLEQILKKCSVNNTMIWVRKKEWEANAKKLEEALEKVKKLEEELEKVKK